MVRILIQKLVKSRLQAIDKNCNIMVLISIRHIIITILVICISHQLFLFFAVFALFVHSWMAGISFTFSIPVPGSWHTYVFIHAVAYTVGSA